MYLGCPSLSTSCNLPGERFEKEKRATPHSSFDKSITLFGLARRGVYNAFAFACEAVRSYRTISPFPHGCGGILSVALSVTVSLGIRRLDVIKRVALS